MLGEEMECWRPQNGNGFCCFSLVQVVGILKSQDGRQQDTTKETRLFHSVTHAASREAVCKYVVVLSFVSHYWKIRSVFITV